ncbi:MAG: hypothetical protein HQL22_09600 [Candidatus Omnitrophica bacterium]|nr:hypothetical protein [Candidatus Omnitrophota bacterium]
MNDYWFGPKVGKWGIGRPVVWQGWLSFLGFAGSVAGLAVFLGLFETLVPFYKQLMFFSCGLIVCILFCYLVRHKVEGGVGLWEK